MFEKMMIKYLSRKGYRILRPCINAGADNAYYDIDADRCVKVDVWIDFAKAKQRMNEARLRHYNLRGLNPPT